MIHPLLSTQKFEETELIGQYHRTLESDLESISPERTMEILRVLNKKTCFHYPKAIQIAHKIAPLFQADGQNLDYFTRPDDCIMVGEKVTGTIPTATEDEIKQQIFQQMFGDEKGNLDELFGKLSKVTKSETLLLFDFTADGKIGNNFSIGFFNGTIKKLEYFSLLQELNCVISNYFSKEWKVSCQYPQIYYVSFTDKTPISVALSQLNRAEKLDTALFTTTNISTVKNLVQDVVNSNIVSEYSNLRISWKLITSDLNNLHITKYSNEEVTVDLVNFDHTNYINKKIMVNLTTIFSFFDSVSIPIIKNKPFHLNKILPTKSQVIFNDTNSDVFPLFIFSLRDFINCGYQLVGNKIIITDEQSEAQQISTILVNKNLSALSDFRSFFNDETIKKNDISSIFCFLSVIHYLTELSFTFSSLTNSKCRNISRSCFFKWANAHLRTVIALGMNDTLLDLIHLKYPFRMCLIDYHLQQEQLPCFTSDLIEAKNYNDIFDTLIDYRLLKTILTIYPSSIDFILYPIKGSWKDFQKADSLVVATIHHHPEILAHINPIRISARVLQEYLNYENLSAEKLCFILTAYALGSFLEHIIVIFRYLKKSKPNFMNLIISVRDDIIQRANRSDIKVSSVPSVFLLQGMLEATELIENFNSIHVSKIWKASTPYVREWMLENLPDEIIQLISYPEIEPSRISSFPLPFTAKSARK